MTTRRTRGRSRRNPTRYDAPPRDHLDLLWRVLERALDSTTAAFRLITVIVITALGMSVVIAVPVATAVLISVIATKRMGQATVDVASDVGANGGPGFLGLAAFGALIATVAATWRAARIPKRRPADRTTRRLRRRRKRRAGGEGAAP